MFWSDSIRRFVKVGTFAAAATVAAAASAQPVMMEFTEIFIDPPGTETQREYVEIASEPDALLEGEGYTYWFVALENEATSNEGTAEKVFQLLGAIDSDGYNWYAPDGGSHMGGTPDDTYGAVLENSGATYFLIAVADGADTPADISSDWDTNDDGTLNSAILTLISSGDWVILDEVGAFCEADDISQGGILYSTVNFAAGVFTNIITPSGSTNVNTNPSSGNFGPFAEIEYVGRTPYSAGVWYAANLSLSGSDFVIGGTASLPECVDTTLDNPYAAGAVIDDTIGSANN